MLRALTDVITGEPYLVDTASGREYRRTVCTLAWPWHPRPGWVVVLAEYRHRPTVMHEARHIDVLAEISSASPEELIRAAERCMRIYHVPRLITPEGDYRIALIELENDRRRAERKPPLRTESPATWNGKGEGLLPFYTSLLHARIVEAKTIKFGNSSLPAEVQPVIADADNAGKSMLCWPAACALFWALEAIDLYPVPEWGGSDRKRPSGPADIIGGY